jgi:hypothetical protein
MVQDSELSVDNQTGTRPVRIIEEEKANLACYFLRSLLSRSLEKKAGEHLLSCFERGVKVMAGEMTSYIYSGVDGIEVSPIEHAKPGITVEGELNDLLKVLLGGGVIMPYLKGEIRVGGNLVGALRMLSLLRIPKSRKP